ncbi:MAG: FAD-dependent oxidoreductase, partial [Planctomycetota bacterium]|nr:FAD-dependent oxidoreductase [Planctomycetota bacterium]
QDRGRVSMSPAEQAQLGRVREIRRRQCEATPPEDVPWSYFDAATACMLLGETDTADRYVQDAARQLTAPWQAVTYSRTLDALEDGGMDVATLRAHLGVKRKSAAEVAEAAVVEATPPYTAATRDAAWYADNVPCMKACPVGTDAGAYVHLLSQGRFEEAYHVARGPNPFASVCGRICAAPCEDACRRGNIDEPVQIRSLKRFLTDRHGVEGFEPRIERVLSGESAPCIEGDAYASHLFALKEGAAKKRVAVIGGGPAGLACAHDLALLGHHVTVFEASHQLGGMMRQGIPIYRLSRDLLELEAGAILSLGVELKLGTPLTPERTLASLLDDGYDAAFLGTGAGKGRDLEVEGAEHDGVVRAIDFLLNANQGYRVTLGQRVVVVGGGNVALDVARTLRLGRPPEHGWRSDSKKDSQEEFGPALEGRALRESVAGSSRQVHCIARQPMGEWPAQRTVHGTEELELARQEGIVFHPLRGVRRILGQDGHVTGVELAEVVQLVDAAGRYAPQYGAHVADVIDCDAVLLAVGQTPDLDYLGAAIATTDWGLIQVDRETLATSMPGVYAGGDAAFGPRTLIEGVSDGKRAARNIHSFLTGEHERPMRYEFEELHPRGVPTAPGYDRIPRCAPPHREVGRRTGISEVELGFDEDAAISQASRCLVCHVQTVYDGDLCIACGRCTEVCPHACLAFVEPDEVDGLDVQTAEDLAAPAGTFFMLKDEDHCIRCGLCAERCPTGAMTMERFDAKVVGS